MCATHTAAAKDPGIHLHRPPDTGPRHRRERRHLYPRQHRPPQKPPRRRSQDAHPPRRHQRLLRRTVAARETGTIPCSPPRPTSYSRRTLPEFEELAAMQAGFAYRPIIARRDGTETEARSVMGEFVSGNYFRTFGLQPAPDASSPMQTTTTGAPMTAVISYEAWQRDYAGDPIRRRQHLLGQYQGRSPSSAFAPQGLLWRPHVQHAAGFLSPDRIHAPARECSLCQRSRLHTGFT